MLDYTSDPPTLVITEYTKTNDFDLLRPQPRDDHGEIVHVYDMRALADMTRDLMGTLSIPYDNRVYPEEPRRKLADFSEAEKRLYLPFAFILACLDGNAFRTGQLNPIFENPDGPASPETISQYIPDAYHIMEANSATSDELFALVENACDLGGPNSSETLI